MGQRNHQLLVECALQSAGLVPIQMEGDDRSGRRWSRTRSTRPSLLDAALQRLRENGLQSANAGRIHSKPSWSKQRRCPSLAAATTAGPAGPTTTTEANRTRQRIMIAHNATAAMRRRYVDPNLLDFGANDIRPALPVGCLENGFSCRTSRASYWTVTFASTLRSGPTSIALPLFT